MPAQTQLQQQTTARSTSTATGGTSTATGGNAAQNLVGNGALANDVTGGKKPKYTGIVHFGMNGGAEAEAGLLNRLNADKGGAKSIRNQKEQDTLVRKGKKLDLSTEEGRTAWLEDLGLEAGRAKQVGDLIGNAGSGARDELGQLVEVYIQAEFGERSMDRLVLSGHNVGSQMWGDDNGTVPFETFVDLREIFPKAAAQVRHLMVSACYSGGEGQMDTYKEAFPGLLSIMAYTGSSPGTWSGAQDHMKNWEKATEKGDGSNVDKDIAKGFRKGENVSTWNSTDGYQGDQPMELWEIESQLSEGDAVFDRYLSGAAVVTDPQSGELRSYYNLVQRALRHPELSGGRRSELEDRRDTTIRLLFFHLIRKKFATEHAAKITAGYAAVKGLTAPDYASLSRVDAISAANGFASAAAASTDAAAAALSDLLQRGLVQLDRDVIPDQWI